MMTEDKDLNSFYEIVEEALTMLDIDPNDARSSQAGQWNLQAGEMVVWIDVWRHEKDNNVYLQVMAPIMVINKDQKNEELFQELLEINNVIFSVSFALNNDIVYLKSIEDAAQINVEAVLSKLKFCGYYTDYYEKRLISKFNGTKLVLNDGRN